MASNSSLRLMVLTLGACLLMLALFGVAGPALLGQPRDNVAMVVQGMQHDSRLDALEGYVKEIKEAKPCEGCQ